MPITFHFKPERNLILCVHSGKILDGEFLDSYKPMVESDEFKAAASLLIDLRRTDSAPRSADVLVQFASFVKLKLAEGGPARRVAVVAPRDLSFGLARMYDMFSDSIPWEFVIFRSLDDALVWLRVPTDLVEDPDGES